MIQRLRRYLEFFTRKDGSSVLEFAIVAPSLILMLTGFIEMGIILFFSSAIESATNIGARVGITGYNGTTDAATRNNQVMRLNYIKQQVYDVTHGLINMSDVNIDITSYNSFSDVGSGSGTANDAGGAGAVVLYTVSYDFPILVPLIGPLIGTPKNGGYVYRIQSVAAVQNEPGILE